jgi:hypothetical protein
VKPIVVLQSKTCVALSKDFAGEYKSRTRKQDRGIWSSFSPFPPFFPCHLLEGSPELVLNSACILHPRHPAHHQKKKPSLWTIPSRKPFSVHWKTGNASKGLKPF